MGTTYRTNLQLHPAEIPENTHKTRKNTEIRLDFSILGVEICSGHQNSLERSFEPLLRGIFSQVCLVGRATNRGSRASFRLGRKFPEAKAQNCVRVNYGVQS